MTNKFKIGKIDFDVVEMNDNYIIVNYNGLDVMLDSTRKLFNASLLIDTINPSKDENGRTVSKWEKTWNNQRFYQFKAFHGELANVIEINKGKHCDYKGKYLSIELFSEFLKTYDYMFYRYWKSGKSVNELPAFVYLEHDSSLKNTQFKLGCTWNILQRLSLYQSTKAPDAHYVFVQRVKNMKEAERVFKKTAIDMEAVQIKGETYAFDDANHVEAMLYELYARLNDDEHLLIKDDSTFIFDRKRIAKDINK